MLIQKTPLKVSINIVFVQYFIKKYKNMKIINKNNKKT